MIITPSGSNGGFIDKNNTAAAFIGNVSLPD